MAEQGVLDDARNVQQNSRPPPPPPPSQLQELKDDLGLSHAQRASLEAEVLARERKSRELENALQKSRTEIKRLNTIIIKGGTPSNGPSDDEVRLEFCGIRDNILRLVRTHFQSTSVRIQQPRGTSTTQLERQSEWLGHWARESQELRNYRVQGLMFDIIYQTFFGRPCFGTETAMERMLREFEERMENSHESILVSNMSRFRFITDCS